MAARKPKGQDGPEVPAGYVPLAGSSRPPSPTARRVGAADENEVVTVTVSLRRRPDGPPVPDADALATRAPDRTRLSSDEFAEQFGAAPDDVASVEAFAVTHGLEVVETHLARRTVMLRGTVTQMRQAFAVDLAVFEDDSPPRRGAPTPDEPEPTSVTYRGRTGEVHIPAELEGIVVGVFGLDDRPVGRRNAVRPPNTTTISVPTVARLYGYPTNSAAGQTIGIFSLSGYAVGDVTAYINSLPGNRPQPTVTDVLINGATNPGTDPFGETTQDIELAAGFAPGADVNVYITSSNQSGWVNAIGRLVHPDPGDAHCSVLSSSWYIANGDDAGTLTSEGITTAFLNALSSAFLDAAIQGVTICIASGDTGTDSKVGDGKAHVQYPGSDPYVLSVGGTTIGNIKGLSFDEYVWNDPFPGNWGTTGGGVSDFFVPPSYQANAHVPPSLNDGHRGRGVPDVAGNANLNSGYSGLVLGGGSFTGNGTSASAPQWAGLIAVINAALGFNVGFINPTIYALGSSPFRDIVAGAGPADNANGGVAGYPASVGWDPCTGWGSPKGLRLLAAFGELPILVSAIAGNGDLPHTCAGDHADQVITIDNAGYGPLLITAITSSNPTIVPPGVDAYPIEVAPGASVEIPIRFRPVAPGLQAATLTFVSNNVLGDHLVRVSGTCPAPRLSLVAANAGSFGEVCVGAFRDEDVWANNSGECTLVITAISSSSPAFVVPETLELPLHVAPGAGLPLPIRFAPSAPGPAVGVITIVSNDPAGAHPVRVSGEAPTGRLTITGNAHFGPVEFGTRAERFVTLTNTGHCALHVSEVAFRPPYRPAGCCDCDGCDHEHPAPPTETSPCCDSFKIVANPFPATIPPSASVGVLIRFTPGCGDSECCELVIESDDPGQPSVTMYATGSLRRTLRSALKCWAAGEIRTLLAPTSRCR